MTDPGPLLGKGRDCDVYALGEERVLRRNRTGASAETEAATISHVRAHGYPAPEVFDVDGADMTMQRVRGTTMADASMKAPWQIKTHARLLADLVVQLAAVPVPTHPLLNEFDNPDVLAHLDLHPLNVMIADGEPVVIDWVTAAAVPAGMEAANTWLTLAAGQTDDNAIMRFLIDRFRGLFIASFLRNLDREEAANSLPLALAYRLGDKNLSAAEKAAMQAVADSHQTQP